MDDTFKMTTTDEHLLDIVESTNVLLKEYNYSGKGKLTIVGEVLSLAGNEKADLFKEYGRLCSTLNLVKGEEAPVIPDNTVMSITQELKIVCLAVLVKISDIDIEKYA